MATAIGHELPWGGTVLEWFVGISDALILITVMATAMAGGERLAYSMARYDMLPHAFARPERGSSPTGAATLAAAVIAPVLIVLADAVGDGARFLAGLYSFGVLIAMTAAQIAVVRLRIREPDLPRPFRVRGNVRWRGASIPVASVIGAVLTLILWVTSLATHGGARIAGPVWLVLGIGVYLLSRRAGGETLLGRATPAVPDLVATPEYDTRRILVPLKLSNIGEEVLATAIRLAEERSAEVRVLCVITVPLSQPLDAVVTEDEVRTHEAMDEVRMVAEEQGVELQAHLVRARSLSEAIISEAKDIDADLIVLGSAPRWRTHKRFFSPAVDEVLRGAPCEVMVVTYPEGVLLDAEES